MENYFILHGSFASPTENWFPWLENELKQRDKEVYAPQMPVGVGIQNFDNWAKALDAYDLNDDSVVIAHSIAAVFICKYLCDRAKKIKKLISVCGFNNFLGADKDYDSVNCTMFMHNLAEAKIHIGEICCYYSDNDPYVPREKEEDFANILGAKAIIIPGAGHINTDTGYEKFEEILAEL